MTQYAVLPITKVMIQDDRNRHFVNMRYFFCLFVRTTICLFLTPNIFYSLIQSSICINFSVIAMVRM